MSPVLLSAERTKKQIISEATYNQMFQLLHKLPYSCRHVVVLLTVPIVFPGIILPELLHALSLYDLRVSRLSHHSLLLPLCQCPVACRFELLPFHPLSCCLLLPKLLLLLLKQQLDAS